MKKHKITIRLPDDVFSFLQKKATMADISLTRVAEQIVIDATNNNKKTIHDCLLEISVNSAAATLELARIIMTDTDRYDTYQQAVIERTKRGITKYKNQI